MNTLKRSTACCPWVSAQASLHAASPSQSAMQRPAALHSEPGEQVWASERQWSAMQTPQSSRQRVSSRQTSSAAQVPHTPPQPSGPHSVPSQEGTQLRRSSASFHS